MYRPTFSDKKNCQIHYAQMRGKGDMGSRWNNLVKFNFEIVSDSFVLCYSDDSNTLIKFCHTILKWGGGGENSVEKYISLRFDICLHLLQKKILLI